MIAQNLNKRKLIKICVIIPEQAYFSKMADRLGTMPSGNFVGFRSQLEESFVSTHTRKLTQQKSLWMTIYIYIYIFIRERA